MGMTINSNIPALGANRQARDTTQILAKTLGQLASGLRINKAADDAAGLAIADRFNTLARQAQTEITNLQSGVSMVQTADAAMSTQQDALTRLRELALQASNGTLTDANRQAINEEAQQLIGQIGETAQNTEFNGTALLNGTTTTVDLGTQAGTQVNLRETTTDALGITGLDLSTAAGATAAVDTIDTAIKQLSGARSTLGGQQNMLESAIQDRQVRNVNAQASESLIRDLDIARATMVQSRNQALLQGSLTALIQSNVTPQNALRLLGT